MYRHDWEAAACYALGPFGAAFMLIFEVENDYVRFHAYQVRVARLLIALSTARLFDPHYGPQSVLLNLVLVLLHIFFYLIFGTWAQYLLVVADFAVLILMRCVSPVREFALPLAAADIYARILSPSSSACERTTTAIT